jgi:hypothetical protein
MPSISYVKYFYLEISYIPNEQITIFIKSKNLYQYYLGNLPENVPNVPIKRTHWKTIWHNIASKHIPSGSRSFWYVLANNKLPLRETLYRQGRVDSPDCLECPGQNEDLTHKYTTCQHTDTSGLSHRTKLEKKLTHV